MLTQRALPKRYKCGVSGSRGVCSLEMEVLVTEPSMSVLESRTKVQEWRKSSIEGFGDFRRWRYVPVDRLGRVAVLEAEACVVASAGAVDIGDVEGLVTSANLPSMADVKGDDEGAGVAL